MKDPLLIVKGEHELCILPGMANHHGLVAGATGTGKTVTLQVIAENLSGIGVPVFMADVKGDLSGISQKGTEKPKLMDRVQQLGLAPFAFADCPVMFWDVLGEQGHPVRATVSDMGPLLLSRLFDLDDTQSGVLSLVFKVADDKGLLLLDLKDLRAMLQYVGDNAADFETEYGRVSKASIGSIQRALLALEEQEGDKFTLLEKWIDLDSQGNAVRTATQEGETLIFGDQPFRWKDLDAAAGDYVIGFDVEDLDGSANQSFGRITVQ